MKYSTILNIIYIYVAANVQSQLMYTLAEIQLAICTLANKCIITNKIARWLEYFS